MTDYTIRRTGDPETTRRAAAEVAAQLDAHLRRHQQRGRPVPMPYDQHDAAPQGRRNTLTIHGTVYARTIHVGDTGPNHADRTKPATPHQALEQILIDLPRAGMRDDHARAVRKATLTALTEARTAQPRPRHLRRALTRVSDALATGIASGGTNALAGDLLHSLLHTTQH